MERTAIFPGSFDPFTRGHAALVDEALNLFDRVVIGIGNNTAKTGLLTVANRKRLIDDLYAGNPRVEAHIYTGLTGEFAEKAGACAIIRVFQIAETFKAKVIDYGKDSLLLEFVQTATKNDAVVKLMKEEFGKIEVVRGGSVGIESINVMER